MSKTLNVAFEGDLKHLPSSNTAEVEVFKDTGKLKLSAPSYANTGEKILLGLDSILEEKAPVEVYQNNNHIGTIIVDINGNGTLEAVLEEGQNIFYAISPETPLHISTISQAILIDTSKRPTTLSIDAETSFDEFIVGDKINLTVKLSSLENEDLSGKTIIISDNGIEETYTTNDNGSVIFPLIVAKNNNIKITFEGDDSFTGITKEIDIAGKKIQPTLERISENEIYRGWFVKIRVTDKNNNPLEGITVIFSAGSKEYWMFSDENGIAKLQMRWNFGSEFTYSVRTFVDDRIGYAEFSETITILDSLVFETTVSGENSIYHVKEETSQIDWFPHLGPALSPLQEKTDEYYARCGRNCQNGLSQNATPSVLNAAIFNFEDLPDDIQYIAAIYVVYTHRYVNCSGTPSVGPAKVILENYLTEEGGTVHAERNGENPPKKGEWTENKVWFSYHDTLITPESLKKQKINVALQYEQNTGAKGLLDVGYIGLRIEYAPNQEGGA